MIALLIIWVVGSFVFALALAKASSKPLPTPPALGGQLVVEGGKTNCLHESLIACRLEFTAKYPSLTRNLYNSEP